jgi:hypothetical protein
MAQSFLEYLDVLIGFALVMLLVSSIVTLITQWLLNVSNYRAQVLQLGLEKLLTQIDGTLGPHTAKIAEAVLMHPLIAGHGMIRGSRPGNVVSREELVRVLLELAKENGLLKDEPARQALAALFATDNLDSPGEVLKAIERRAMELEVAFPTAASHFRQTRAIVENAAGSLVSGVMAWFDETSDRMTQLFARRARAVAIGVSLLVAVGIPLDSIELLERLAGDEQLRASAVRFAEQTVAEAQKQEQTAAEEKKADLKKDIESIKASMKKLDEMKLGLLPADWPRWPDWRNIPGIILTTALLSMGGPFWFETMKRLLKFRPVLATKEEKERTERKEALSPSTTADGGPEALPPVAGREGEAGDLSPRTITPQQGSQG